MIQQLRRRFIELYLELLKKSSGNNPHVDTHFGSVYVDSSAVIRAYQGKDINPTNFISFKLFGKSYDDTMDIGETELNKVIECMEKELK